jgi:hypothetical protein
MALMPFPILRLNIKFSSKAIFIFIKKIFGKPLVWDVTVVDTLADSYVLKTSEVSGFAAEMACKRKHNKNIVQLFRQTTYLKV